MEEICWTNNGEEAFEVRPGAFVVLDGLEYLGTLSLDELAEWLMSSLPSPFDENGELR